MRIKSFTGSSVMDAMNKVRTELGDEAVILATQSLPTGESQVTAAIEQSDPSPDPVPIKSEWATDWDSDWRQESKKNPSKKVVAAAKIEDQTPKTGIKKEVQALKAPPHQSAALEVSEKMELLVQAMAYHGVPTLLAERICRTALAVETEDTTIALAASLDRHFNFSPKFSRKKIPLMLIGPPGVGKTMTIAKMAASAKLEKRDVHIITSDTSRAGAIDQLKAFTDILGLKLWIAESTEQLATIVKKPELQDGAHILIDTGGVNCYDQAELEDLAAKIVAAGAEAVAVLPAGTDSSEMSDTAQKYSAIGANRLIVTRLDTTRRYGGIFSAADSANLSFSYASVSSSVATGLHVINPVNLARLILRDPTLSGISNEFDKAKK